MKEEPSANGNSNTTKTLVPFLSGSTSATDFTNTSTTNHASELVPRGGTHGWISAIRSPPGILASLNRRPSAPPQLTISQNRYLSPNNQITEEKKTERKDFVKKSCTQSNTFKVSSDNNKRINNQYSRRKNSYDAMTMTLSALYAKLLVVLGMAFPISEMLAKQVPPAFYQAFYLYMYVGSICFISIMYCILLKDKTVAKIVRSASKNEKSNKLGYSNPSNEIVRYGSFYLRLGAIGFGIGSMVYSGLEVGEYFELKKDNDCSNYIQVIIPAARMLLTLLQIQFLFVNSKYMKLQKVKIWSCFGIMHLIAMNLCEWLLVLVEETKHEIAHVNKFSTNHHYSINDKKITLNSDHNLNEEDYSVNKYEYENEKNRSLVADIMKCRESNIVGSLVQSSSAFLFPCTIEYSLICAVILFEIWKNIQFQNPPNDEDYFENSEEKYFIENRYNRKCSFYNIGGAVGVHSHLRTSYHFSIDCTSAHRGLFAGILALVFTIISLILFFVLNKDDQLKDIGIYQVHVWELIIYIITIISMIVCFIQIKDLPYERHFGGLGLDNSLLVMAQLGTYIYCIFSIIGFNFTNSYNSKIGLATELFSLLQTTIQTVFILDSCWRRCTTSDQFRRKPGRQMVTFLLISNMALWSINALEKSHAEFRPTLLEFFGVWPWTIITHVSMPLGIFYRFHSTICLFEIWKMAYKLKPSLLENNNNNNHV